MLFYLLREVFAFLIFFLNIINGETNNAKWMWLFWSVVGCYPKGNMVRHCIWFSWPTFLSMSVWCCCWEEGEYFETNYHNLLLRSELMGVGSSRSFFHQKEVEKWNQKRKLAFQERWYVFVPICWTCGDPRGDERETSWEWLQVRGWNLEERSKSRHGFWSHAPEWECTQRMYEGDRRGKSKRSRVKTKGMMTVK